MGVLVRRLERGRDERPREREHERGREQRRRVPAAGRRRARGVALGPRSRLARPVLRVAAVVIACLAHAGAPTAAPARPAPPRGPRCAAATNVAARRRAALALGGIVEQPLERAGERVGVERHELDRPVGAEHRARARALEVDARAGRRRASPAGSASSWSATGRRRPSPPSTPTRAARASRRRCARTGTRCRSGSRSPNSTIRTSGRRALSSSQRHHAERHGAPRRHRAGVEDDRVVAPGDRPRVVDVMVHAVLERARPRRRSGRCTGRAATGSPAMP